MVTSYTTTIRPWERRRASGPTLSYSTRRALQHALELIYLPRLRFWLEVILICSRVRKTCRLPQRRVPHPHSYYPYYSFSIHSSLDPFNHLILETRRKRKMERTGKKERAASNRTRMGNGSVVTSNCNFYGTGTVSSGSIQSLPATSIGLRRNHSRKPFISARKLNLIW